MMLQEKSPKYIWYLCADTEESLNRWLTGIRIVKRKAKLLDNFKLLQEDMSPLQQKAPPEMEHPEENNRSDDGRESRARNNDIIYSPASESRSFDSGVSSISEVNNLDLCNIKHFLEIIFFSLRRPAVMPLNALALQRLRCPSTCHAQSLF